jgi:hypothetical protein
MRKGHIGGRRIDSNSNAALRQEQEMLTVASAQQNKKGQAG